MQAQLRPVCRPILALSLAGLALALALVGGCGGAGAEGEGTTAEKPRNVRALALQPSTLEEYLELSGRAAPLRGTVISAEEGGRVETVRRDKGSRVATGEVIIALDRRLLAAELESARAARDLAAFDAARQESLLASASISEIEVEATRTQLKQVEAALAAATLRHERALISAPFAGVISDRFVEPGQLIAPGMPVARLVDPRVLKLECTVGQRDVHLVLAGAPATVDFGVEGPQAAGRVHWVGLEADPLTGEFPVEIHVDNPELVLRAGVLGRARLLKARHENQLCIPRDAVLERGGGPAVFVVEAGRAVERAVQLGADQGLMVVVTAGLAAGEQLVVRGQRDLVDGGPVTVTETATAADGSLASDPQAFGAGAAAGGAR